MTDISNREDVIDSRDVVARIEELETELADGRDAARNAFSNEDRGDMTVDAFVDEYIETNLFSEREELKALLALQEEAEGYAPDWKYGATLIRESYFTDYCKELCEDIGDLPRGMPAYLVIDWKATADNLRVDYTEADFDGVTYLVR